MTPLTAAEVTGASLKFDDLTAAPDGRLMWLEGRPAEGGRKTLVCWSRENGKQDLTPPGFDVGSGLHGYGGGAYACSEDGARVLVSSDRGLFTVTERGEPELVASAGPGVAFGDVHADGPAWLAVRESEATGTDALVALREGGQLELVSDSFIAAPTPHGNRLAWLTWRNDEMPWDSTRLWVSTRGENARLAPAQLVAGGPDESVLEPRWGPDGHLYFVSDRSGWWNVYRWSGKGIEPVAPMEADCAAAPWEAGYASYCHLADGRIVLIRHGAATQELVVVKTDGTLRPLPLEYTSFKPYLAPMGTQVAVIAASATSAPRVVLVDVDDPLRPVLLSSDTSSSAPPVSCPEHLEVWSDGQLVHALLYPPTGAGPDWSAPLVVRPHPGPTDRIHERLNWHVQFFTSRGFAVVDVDYRGSTGYGRAYRQSLDGHWGEYDVADCRAVAEHLLAIGRSRPGAVFISGASAGAYTALKAVGEAEPFAVAVAAMSITDPDRWVTTAHRFQRPHAARLAGKAGAVRASEIERPVLLLHGARDRVAPVQDAVDLATALEALGKPHQLTVFEHAGHGFSDPRYGTAALEAELELYQSLLG